MIIQCKSCSRKFLVQDKDIPKEGRTVQCGHCSQKWFQTPAKTESPKIKTNIEKVKTNIKKEVSKMELEASDGKTYQFLGNQWAELLPSGKTGILAKKKISDELNKLSGLPIAKKTKKTSKRESDKTKKTIDPSSEQINNKAQSKENLGFFGYIFLIIIIAFSFVGILETFENNLTNSYPEMIYIYELLDEQLEYIAETTYNIITILKDLINSY